MNDDALQMFKARCRQKIETQTMRLRHLNENELSGSLKYWKQKNAVKTFEKKRQISRQKSLQDS